MNVPTPADRVYAKERPTKAGEERNAIQSVFRKHPGSLSRMMQLVSSQLSSCNRILVRGSLMRDSSDFIRRYKEHK